MKTVYIYVLETLADWEIAHITSEIYSRRFFKKDAEDVIIKYVGSSMSAIKTMGGLTIIPDCTVDSVPVTKETFLILPGADTWNDEAQYAIIEKAMAILNEGGNVCAICGATVALAAAGILNTRKHTSNGVGFLDMFVPTYEGKGQYIDEHSVCDDNLVTAAGTGAIDFTKFILNKLEVMKADALESWYEYFKTGNAGAFFALMQAVNS